ncbi:MAG TPA: DJ-1/PfpI family protein [Kofleriaceae bacterium]|nr:DJ-1/PfpI family protein [Kofleriaceae bacterium]
MALQIGMLLFPKLTQLDLTGPQEVLARIPDAKVHIVAKTREPVTAETGLTLVPSTTFAELPQVDLLFVPGGAGQIDAAEDDATIGWLRQVGAQARWITSACTGSLLLGCAGLLRGYRATTHWAFFDLLPLVGAIPTDKRVVVDRNRMTSGGVTAGIDIALTIAAEVAGREHAEAIQLSLEYDPEPPFRAGHPNVARPDLVERVRATIAKRHAQRKAQLEQLARG